MSADGTVIIRDRLGNPVAWYNANGEVEFLPLVSASINGTVQRRVSGTISAADIIATTAGKFGHANGVELAAAPGADVGLELVMLIAAFDRATAAYTAGGNITVNATAGAALTGLVSAANSLGAAGDKVAIFRPLAAAAEVVAPNTGISLVSSAAFTNPGTAAGVIRWQAIYRLHTLGLT